MTWAKMLKRAFDIDIQTSLKCEGIWGANALEILKLDWYNSGSEKISEPLKKRREALFQAGVTVKKGFLSEKDRKLEKK